jgi:hypothetical protein
VTSPNDHAIARCRSPLIARVGLAPPAGALALIAGCAASVSPCTTPHLALRPRVDSNGPTKLLFAVANIGRTSCVIGGHPGIELDAGGDGRPVVTQVSRIATPPARRITFGFRSQAGFFLYQLQRRCEQPRINVGHLLVTPPQQSAGLSLDVTFGPVSPDQPVYVTALAR